jgi:hypothetical protein
MLAFGALVGTQTSALTANEPTPWLGVQERITAYVPMLWFVVLAVAMLRCYRLAAAEQRAMPVTASTHMQATPP